MKSELGCLKALVVCLRGFLLFCFGGDDFRTVAGSVTESAAVVSKCHLLPCRLRGGCSVCGGIIDVTHFKI